MIRAVTHRALCISSLFLLPFYGNSATEPEVEKITVEGAATANESPVGTFNSPVSNLEYDPRVDLQSRNMAEAQADVTIRGGIFENTGFRIGSATIIDPQTGHYFAEIPIAPEMLKKPAILTGVDNALYGMNSSVGTVAYAWRPIKTAGSVSVGVGNNNANLQRAYAAVSWPLSGAAAWKLGAEGEYSRSESDGSIANGDHHFERAAGRIQLSGQQSQTDLFVGYQEKFFGWPNLYTPFNVNETEDLESRLLMFNHQQQYGRNSNIEVSAYYRKHLDDYVFSREDPQSFRAFHETKVAALALSGQHSVDTHWALNYASQFSADDIASTTLENNFVSRKYSKLSVVPQYTFGVSENEQVILRLGAAYDDTNRDDAQLSLISDAVWRSLHADNTSQTVSLSYAQASQVAGYTAIGGSTTSGLFRSNDTLQRETSKNLELGVSLDSIEWRLDSAVFYRWDNDLTDWTYRFDATSARVANPVDIETIGVEFFAVKRLEKADLVAGYTYLHKSEDYRDAAIDASFYALNYPPHRLTFGAVWYPVTWLEIRADNEWRKQQENALRNGADSAFFTHLTLTYTPPQINGFNIVLAVDNAWNESFEEIPGTPGRGQQLSATATYSW
ncbi:TonB-dependent receptor plug domain-containing protein [Salinimonas sediminis]|uniref:TonB-dependent receptor n=1 Tax=Salinimonas sediminis TaxID=2303538 RepID=A0A346NQ40_9ALTE|nr:TonB-dependent receptor [Salinimonas sediminis]AXR07647.1 TonB-dependent receptor [Salinimonas sediminis]